MPSTDDASTHSGFCSPASLEYIPVTVSQSYQVDMMDVGKLLCLPWMARLERTGLKYWKEKDQRFDHILCEQDCGEAKFSHVAGENAKQSLWRRMYSYLTKITLVTLIHPTSKMNSIGKIWSDMHLKYQKVGNNPRCPSIEKWWDQLLIHPPSEGWGSCKNKWGCSLYADMK